jgi:glycosyltransferase involved in cell wall biosynthesis
VLHGSLDDPRAIVEEAAVAVLTSTTEGLPNVVLEALAAGVPVVATAVGAIPELLAAGGGTAVPVNDVPAIAHAVERYLRDPALRGATGDAGRAAVRSYGIDVAVDRHLVVFEAPR